MKFARGLMIVTYGLVAIAAQTLLFREFITAFEGNDISVGVFFGSWFLWIGLGAIVVRRRDRLAETLLRHIEPLFLSYIPAFLVQLFLIVRVRELAGVASYDLVSVQRIVLWAMVVNAPVSFVTGGLFPIACRWIEQTHAFPVSRVYILEAIGSFAGGLAVTALLAWRVPTVRISLFLALDLSIVVAVLCRRDLRGAFAMSLTMAALTAAILFTGADGYLTRQVQTLKWGRLLPRETFQGAFQTAQAEYLYGEYGGQWIAMREGSVCEALPGEEESGRIAATVLCQTPQARRVLVIGSGMALCSRFLMLPQIEHVAWAHPDIEYARRLLDCVPSGFAINDVRFYPIADEIRRYLSDTRDSFDLVVLNLPEASSSAFNRYFTVEFYDRIKGALHAGGVVAVGIAGGEDILGAELIGLGASTRATLAKTFSNQVLVPGEQTWLIASDSKGLIGDPAIARDRFAAMEGSQRVFPPTGLLSVYLPDRAAQATAAYDRTNAPERLLVNHDSRPLTYLYGLLLAARQSGASTTRLVTLLTLAGWLPFVVPILVFVALRMWMMAGRRSDVDRSSFDSIFLVLSTGWAAISMTVLLMYLYETQFGSLYLHIGLISSLFMAGLTVGAGTAGWLIARHSGRRFLHALLVGILLVHAIVLIVLAFGLGGAYGSDLKSGHVLFSLAFVLSGLCCGGYWPIAATQLAGRTLDSSQAGGRLEAADHIGACLGGLATSLLMVPVLGVRTSLLILIGLVLANLPAVVAGLRRNKAPEVSLADTRWRPVRLALFGVCACVVLCSDLLTRAGARLQPALPLDAISALAGEQQTQQTWATLESDGRRVSYVTILDADQKPAGYLFSSADFAPAVRGFGGRLNLVIHTDTGGRLVNLFIARSNETPSYLDTLRDWLGTLKGRSLFEAQSLAGVNAVAGATGSSDAILSAVRKSGRLFAVDVLENPATPGLDGESYSVRAADGTSLYLIAMVLLALAAIWVGQAWGRIVVLALAFFLGGIVLNAQYSSEQIATLLSWDVPRAELAGAFLLVIGVPALVLLFGNIYCGYLCPFGAAQELLGYVLPRRFRPAPARGILAKRSW